MRRAGLYLNGQRFEVVRLSLKRTQDVWAKRRRTLRGYIKGLPDITLNGHVIIPPACDREKLHAALGPDGPVAVRYRGMTGRFWLDASISSPRMTFRAVAAGPVKWVK